MLAAREDAAVLAASTAALAMGGLPQASLIGSNRRLPVNGAAMVNAVMASTLDMDDGAYRPVGHLGHAGGVLVPTALALAESRHASGKDLILATVIGYEMALRVGWLSFLGGQYAPAGMVGNFGAAAVTARLLGLDAMRTAHALGIAEAHCLHPSRAKNYHHMTMTKEAAGWGAMTGVSAALLAEAGFEGPETIFDLPDNSPEPLATLGQEWEIMGLYFKPYSLCRYAHAPVDGLLDLMRENQLVAADVAGVTVGIATPAVEKMLNYRPENTWEAQFSLPYGVGAALADGVVLPAQIAPRRIHDTAILAQVDKVSVVVDAEADALRPGMVAARVTLVTAAGETLTTFVSHPRGEPANPLSAADLAEKFKSLTAPGLGPEKSAELFRALSDLEAVGDVAPLVADFQPAA